MLYLGYLTRFWTRLWTKIVLPVSSLLFTVNITIPKLIMRFMVGLCNPFSAINSLWLILFCAGPIFKESFIPCDVRTNYTNIYPTNIYLVKPTIETLEKSVKYVQSYQWRHQNDVIGTVLLSSLLSLNMFYIFF